MAAIWLVFALWVTLTSHLAVITGRCSLRAQPLSGTMAVLPLSVPSMVTLEQAAASPLIGGGVAVITALPFVYKLVRSKEVWPGKELSVEESPW